MQKLESETLPQFFRHSRFQSLVRQLNFYNFRKVNRERTFWIYKHRLFHRDRPHDLHLLRRRTCPGVDGRKNRFSHSRRDGEAEDSDEGSQRKNSDEESSVELIYNSDEDESPSEAPKHRSKTPDLSGSRPADAKKPRRAVVEDEKALIVEDEENVDVSMICRMGRLEVFLEVPVKEETVSSDIERDERAERRVQSHVVSQVAMKLEEYVKKAKRSIGRTRGGGRAGSVTPPPLHGGTVPSGQHSRSLITYDDEYEESEFLYCTASAAAVVTDGDDSMTSEEDIAGCSMTSSGSRRKEANGAFCKAPVDSVDTIRKVINLILATSRGESDLATAAIARFCMSTPPLETSDLCCKILGLLSSCESLAFEFQQYRAALHPVDNFSVTGLPPSTFTQGFRKNDAVSVQQIWKRAGSRVDAVRDFKTFAVNYIHAGLEQNLRIFGDEEVAVLKKTADIWLRSVVMN